jgi:hypothetical protein
MIRVRFRHPVDSDVAIQVIYVVAGRATALHNRKLTMMDQAFNGAGGRSAATIGDIRRAADDCRGLPVEPCGHVSGRSRPPWWR